jgi:pimeloyl-ACP methyl ester carboxylesterase
VWESRFIRRQGTRLHGLWRPGRGAPIVVLPGVMADAESFVPVAEAIALPEPVLVIDRRGRASSGPLGEGYSLETEVADAKAWIDRLGGAVSLVGWSYGATIAIETAARDRRVERTIGYEPVLGPFGTDALPALRVADLARRVEIVNVDVSRLPGERVEELRATPAWPVLCRLSEPLVEELEALNAFSPDERWRDVGVELIIGSHSLGVEPYGPAFDRVAELLPRSATTVLPGHGHLAHAEDPSALGSLIGDLMSRPAAGPLGAGTRPSENAF